MSSVCVTDGEGRGGKDKKREGGYQSWREGGERGTGRERGSQSV